MSPRPAEAIQDRLTAALGPYIASETVAVGVDLGIRTEAAVRRALASGEDIVSAVISRTTSVTACRQRSRVIDARSVEREQASRTAGHRSRPVVHWHRSGDGPPLLLLNGWTASGLAWPEAWLHRLEESYDVIRIDNRGTGWSRSAPSPFTIADLADDARDVHGIGRDDGARRVRGRALHEAGTEGPAAAQGRSGATVRLPPPPSPSPGRRGAGARCSRWAG